MTAARSRRWASAGVQRGRVSATRSARTSARVTVGVAWCIGLLLWRLGGQTPRRFFLHSYPTPFNIHCQYKISPFLETRLSIRSTMDAGGDAMADRPPLLSMRLDDVTRQRLDELAARMGLNRSNVIRLA